MTWTDFLRILCKSLRPHLDRFDRDDPISFCMSQRSVLAEFADTCLSRDAGKSASASSDYMREGDDRLAAGSLDESLSSYSNSIIFAPRDSPGLAVAYAKRALLLHHMHHYEESVRDMALAMSLCYPEYNARDLRQAQRFIALGDYDKAQMHLTAASSALTEPQCSRESANDERERVKEMFRIHIMKMRCMNRRSFVKRRNKQELPALEKGENPDFPSSSNALTVLYAKGKGRYVVAKTDIKLGDVLFVEKPFSFVVFKSFCSRCCGESIAPIPCWTCVDVIFCSEECRDAAWSSFHRFECGFFELLRETGIAHLALRIVFEAAPTLEHLRKMTEGLARKDTTYAANAPVTFGKNRYANVYRLETHVSKLEVKDLLQYSLTATLLALYVVRYTEFAARTDDNVGFCANLILRHATQLICNGHAVDRRLSKEGGDSPLATEKAERIGCAVYPSVSIINHSCEASVVHSFQDSYLVVRASKDIKKGEEVFHTYGIDCRGMKRSDRRAILNGQYHFECTCEPCSADYDPYDVMNSLKCGRCKGALVESTKAASTDRKTMFCVHCKNLESVSEETFAARSEIEKLLEVGEHDLDVVNDVSSALRSFTRAWTLSRRILFRFHKDLSRAADEIARCLFLLEDYERCLMFLKCSLLAVERRYGSFSIELANEAHKFGDVVKFYVSRGADDGGPRAEAKGVGKIVADGLKYYKLSEKIFGTLYGWDHPLVAEIQDAIFSLASPAAF